MGETFWEALDIEEEPGSDQDDEEVDKYNFGGRVFKGASILLTFPGPALTPVPFSFVVAPTSYWQKVLWDKAVPIWKFQEPRARLHGYQAGRHSLGTTQRITTRMLNALLLDVARMSTVLEAWGHDRK